MEDIHPIDPSPAGHNYGHDHGDEYEHTAGTVILPTPTAMPIIFAFGVALGITGMVTHWVITALGVVLSVRGAIGWFFQVLPHENHIAVPTAAAIIPITSARVTRDHLPAIEGHHEVHPIETFSLAAGIKGGLAGAVAMVIPAAIFGLLRFHSIWYPINLLAAGGFVSWAGESTEFLSQFHLEGLLAAGFIHLLASVLIGLLYAAMLPIFPRKPILTAGFVAPLLWTGLLYTAIGVISPILNDRISWRWFIPSQIAFGLVCGFVVNLHIKVRSAQFRALPFAVRAGIESDRPVSDQESDKPDDKDNKKDDYV
jgi:hypothetical protein